MGKDDQGESESEEEAKTSEQDQITILEPTAFKDFQNRITCMNVLETCSKTPAMQVGKKR